MRDNVQIPEATALSVVSCQTIKHTNIAWWSKMSVTTTTLTTFPQSTNLTSLIMIHFCCHLFHEVPNKESLYANLLNVWTSKWKGSKCKKRSGMDLIRERKHTHMKMMPRGYMVSIWNTIKDLVFSSSLEGNYTDCICCSVWFMLAAWGTAKALGRKGQKCIAQRLSSRLPWPGFRQPQKAG